MQLRSGKRKLDAYQPTFDPNLDIATVVFSHVQCVGTRLRLATWLHENGYPMVEEACRYAAQYNQWHCLRYLVDNKCPGWEEYAEFLR